MAAATAPDGGLVGNSSSVSDLFAFAPGAGRCPGRSDTKPAITGALLSVPPAPTARSEARIAGPALERSDPPGTTVGRPVPTAGALDLAKYPSAAADEVQCPTCGGFAVDQHRATDRLTLTCRGCRTPWSAGAGQPQPDVVVRSWLHR